MVEIPDRLECLFTASLTQRGDSYTIEIPQTELDNGTIASNETYRVAILPSTGQDEASETRQPGDSAPSAGSMASPSQTPPVAEGDVREVAIETIGDQGDGIAKVERGYVVIVPEAEIGNEVTVEITNARENVAFARVRDDKNTSGESFDPDEPFEGDTL